MINMIKENKMAKLSLWNPRKGNDYEFADRISGENLRYGGTAVLVHKYIGTPEEQDETTIQDFLFLENRNRKYDENVFELKGHYSPDDVDYDLSQFGIFLSSDTLRLVVHYNDMIDMLGRKLMSGDVLELPNQRDFTDDGTMINKFYVVQDSLFSAPGYGPSWRPHLWKIRAKQMPDAPEYSDIISHASTNASAGGEGNGTGLMPPGYSTTATDGEPGFGEQDNIRNAFSRYCKILEITDEIVKEAEENAFYDPTYFETQNLYIMIDEDTGYPLVHRWHSGDGIPPNGAPLKGIGIEFPEDIKDGEYFLRIDYKPDRLFQKQGNCFVRIEDDLRKIWTAYNKRLDTFIDNINKTKYDDGSEINEKQALSKVLKSKVDLNKEHKDKIKKIKEKHDLQSEKNSRKCDE